MLEKKIGQIDEHITNKCYRYTYYADNHEIGSFMIIYFTSNPEVRELAGVYIEEQYRNKGYGTKMLKEWLEQEDANSSLILDVHQDNPIAIHLYKNLGFSIEGGWDYYGTPCYRMTKEI